VHYSKDTARTDEWESARGAHKAQRIKQGACLAMSLVWHDSTTERRQQEQMEHRSEGHQRGND
jgi:hypothetical protein